MICRANKLVEGTNVNYKELEDIIIKAYKLNLCFYDKQSLTARNMSINVLPFPVF